MQVADSHVSLDAVRPPPVRADGRLRTCPRRHASVALLFSRPLELALSGPLGCRRAGGGSRRAGVALQPTCHWRPDARSSAGLPPSGRDASMSLTSRPAACCIATMWRASRTPAMRARIRPCSATRWTVCPDGRAVRAGSWDGVRYGTRSLVVAYSARRPSRRLPTVVRLYASRDDGHGVEAVEDRISPCASSIHINAGTASPSPGSRAAIVAGDHPAWNGLPLSLLAYG